jgi:aspartyl-tRNA(Asn)/glutamyl-tRNA(Gln) amidotransferase subunit B
VYEREKPQQLSDPAALEKMIEQTLASNPKQVEQYREGKVGVLGFFIGQVMKASSGQANPALVNELLKKKLGGS